MDKILFFYENNKNNLQNYDKRTINELLDLLENISINDKENWIIKSKKVLELFNKEFSNFNSHYSFKINECLYNFKNINLGNIDYNILNSDEKDIYKKIKLNIKFLEYLQILNINKRVFCDKDKYDIIYDTYNIFNSFDCLNNDYIVEWYSNQYIFFCSKNYNNVNICIYELDDMYGYKLFLTFKNNYDSNYISINIYDCVLNNAEDFYDKLETKKWYFNNSPVKKNYNSLIDISQIAIEFNEPDNPNIKFYESHYVEQNKMLEHVKDFLSKFD